MLVFNTCFRAGFDQRVKNLHTPRPARFHQWRSPLLVFDTYFRAGLDQILTKYNTPRPARFQQRRSPLLVFHGCIRASSKHLRANKLDTRLQPRHTRADSPLEPLRQHLSLPFPTTQGLALHLNPLFDELTKPFIPVELHGRRVPVLFQRISTRFSRRLAKGSETVLGAL